MITVLFVYDSREGPSKVYQVLYFDYPGKIPADPVGKPAAVLLDDDHAADGLELREHCLSILLAQPRRKHRRRLLHELLGLFQAQVRFDPAHLRTSSRERKEWCVSKCVRLVCSSFAKAGKKRGVPP